RGRSRLRAGCAHRAGARGGGRMDARTVREERALSAAPHITVLVPAWNEAESIPALHLEIAAVLETLGRPWEVLYVDDGSRDGTQALEVYGEFHRFMPALTHWAGFRVGEAPVHHRARRFGHSKFGAARFVNGFLDLLSAAFISLSALKPLHVFGRIGLGFLAL